MPYVNVQVTRDPTNQDVVTREQKAQLVAEITDSLRRILNKKPEHTHIVIQEIDTDNWGFAGQLTTDLRAQATPPKGAS